METKSGPWLRSLIALTVIAAGLLLHAGCSFHRLKITVEDGQLAQTNAPASLALPLLY